MRRATGWILVSTALAAAAAGIVHAQAARPEDAAQQAAEAWLALVDQAKYAESWSEGATLFQSAVARDNWAEAAGAARGPLGTLVSRRLRSRTYTESLPGVPDGKYVVIQYDASFANKKEAVETITPMLDGDRGWRVSGYFVK